MCACVRPSRNPRPLRNEDYMGDVIVQKARQRRDFKFVFKRKIFLPSHNSVSEDNMFSRLVYLQVQRWVHTRRLSAGVASIIMQVACSSFFLLSLSFSRARVRQSLFPLLSHSLLILFASPFAATTKTKAEDEVITQGKLPIKAEAAVLKLSSISYRVALDEDWPADPDEMANHPECPVIGELGYALCRLPSQGAVLFLLRSVFLRFVVRSLFHVESVFTS